MSNVNLGSDTNFNPEYSLGVAPTPPASNLLTDHDENQLTDNLDDPLTDHQITFP